MTEDEEYALMEEDYHHFMELEQLAHKMDEARDHVYWIKRDTRWCSIKDNPSLYDLLAQEEGKLKGLRFRFFELREEYGISLS